MNRAYRLQKNRAFQQVYRRGKSVACRHAVLLYARLAHRAKRDELKIGFSVSRKIGNAVVRNRVKRRMREAVRLALPLIAPGYHLVIVARPPSAQADYHELDQALQGLLRRAGLTRRQAQ